MIPPSNVLQQLEFPALKTNYCHYCDRRGGSLDLEASVDKEMENLVQLVAPGSGISITNFQAVTVFLPNNS